MGKKVHQHMETKTTAELPTLTPERQLQIALIRIGEEVVRDGNLVDINSARRGLAEWAKKRGIKPNEALALVSAALELHLTPLLVPFDEKQ
jgi:hypothetical protein